jgi:hypothetical protein
MKKLYIEVPSKIEYIKDSEGVKILAYSIVRVDNSKLFERFFTDQDFLFSLKDKILRVKIGEAVKPEPYIFELEDLEFESIVKFIKSKISSIWKNELSFKYIPIVEDSRHLPIIILKNK